jgi:hypothetical protein
MVDQQSRCFDTANGGSSTGFNKHLQGTSPFSLGGLVYLLAATCFWFQVFVYTVVSSVFCNIFAPPFLGYLTLGSVSLLINPLDIEMKFYESMKLRC